MGYRIIDVKNENNLNEYFILDNDGAKFFGERAETRVANFLVNNINNGFITKLAIFKDFVRNSNVFESIVNTQNYFEECKHISSFEDLVDLYNIAIDVVGMFNYLVNHVSNVEYLDMFLQEQETFDTETNMFVKSPGF